MNVYDALLIVCFGTTDPEQFNRCFVSIYQRVCSQNTYQMTVLSVCRQSIRDKLRNRGIDVPLFEEELHLLRQSGYRNIHVLPLLLADGGEWIELKNLCDMWRSDFDSIQIELPLLLRKGSFCADWICSQFPKKCGDGILLLGHGSGCNGAYHQLQKQLDQLGREEIQIALLHGNPDGFQAAETLIRQGCHHLVLGFFMISCGYHVRKVLEEDHGLFQQLKKAGIPMTVQMLCCGEDPAFQMAFMPEKNKIEQ